MDGRRALRILARLPSNWRGEMLHWKTRTTVAVVGVLAAIASVGGFGWTWH
jgi:hypothetical protein